VSTGRDRPCVDTMTHLCRATGSRPVSADADGVGGDLLCRALVVREGELPGVGVQHLGLRRVDVGVGLTISPAAADRLAAGARGLDLLLGSVLDRGCDADALVNVQRDPGTRRALWAGGTLRTLRTLPVP
jgi:hypothetical protein